MKDLTFGEQVKIILSRKGMTIKELAEQIQEETGKAMSRQNLTQRLGRDNFQEQDMRMVAKILGCPFRLSIFPTDNEEDFTMDDEALLSYAKKSGKKRKEKAKQEEVYQQEFVFDETMTASVAEMLAISAYVEEAAEKVVEEPKEATEVYEEPVLTEPVAEEETQEEVAEESEEAEEIYEEPALTEPVAEEETQEEVAEESEEAEEIYEEPALTEPVAEGETQEEVAEESEEIYEEPVLMEPVAEEETQEEVAEESEEIYEEPARTEPIIEEEQAAAHGEVYEQKAEAVESIEERREPEPVKQDRIRTGAIFLRGFGRNRNKKNKKADKIIEKVQEVKSDVQEEEPVIQEEPAAPVVERKPRPVITPASDDFEPIVKYYEEEDLNVGELNPYTGREYQTNSVRMHPSKIGYVQVYDRVKHGWVDMTEWAFLGYQEEKKKVLGRNYEPPIYLD